MKTINFLDKVEHLLANLETEDESVKAEILSLRSRVRGLIHLVSVGHETAALFGLNLLKEDIDKVVTKLNNEPPDAA